jgi:hypothetical protein
MVKGFGKFHYGDLPEPFFVFRPVGYLGIPHVETDIVNIEKLLITIQEIP